MPNTVPLIMTSLEDVKQNIDLIKETFVRDAIVVLRGMDLGEAAQKELTRLLGDAIGWVPNNSSDFSQRYEENHSHNERKSEVGGDEVALMWHMEHVDYDNDSSIVAGVWNMRVFNTDPENGKTYFADSAKIYNLMPIEWQDFLSKSVSKWYENGREGDYHITHCLKKHWITGEDVIRIDITDMESIPGLLHEFDGRTPTDEEHAMYAKIRDHFVRESYGNEEVRYVHRWQQGDIVIPDLFKMVHAVTGGFESKDRSFIGYWAYPKPPKSR